MDTKSVGVVYLVGAGPGDPGLLTVRGRELLADCDAIVFDALANPALLPLADANGRPERHDVGKRGGSAASARQDEINALLVEKTRAGLNVVRLKGGDPFLFGRGGEEAQALASAGLKFEVVPGVTSAIAAPAYAGIPVTHRGKTSHVTFFTGHEEPAKADSSIDFAALAKLGGTQVMLMGVERIEAISQQMLANGMRADLPVALIRWATTGRQQTLVGTLSNIATFAIALR